MTTSLQCLQMPGQKGENMNGSLSLLLKMAFMHSGYEQSWTAQ